MDFKEHIYNSYDEKIAFKLIEALNNPRTHALILNSDKISDEQFISLFPHVKKHPFVKHAFLYDKEEYDFGKSYLHIGGAIYISDASSLVVASILNANKYDYVLDMCAAPGGKTLQTSLLMQNEGVIISNDLSYQRALVLSQNVERLGRKNIIVTSNDLSKLPAKYYGLFTKIILDAPCSGSGMFRKEEKMLKDWSIDKVIRQSAIQKELIELAYNFLAPGGTLIYSTCSYSKEENYEVIKTLLANHNDMSLIPLKELESYSLTNAREGITMSPATFEGEGQYLCVLKKDGNLNYKEINLPDIKSKFFTYNLKGYLINKDDNLYASPTNLNLKEFNIIRNGLKIGSLNKNNFIPDYHLSHFLSSNESIELNENELKNYLNGQVINKDYQNGFYVVSYNDINIGFVKSVNGILKNHFPKGLRI